MSFLENLELIRPQDKLAPNTSTQRAREDLKAWRSAGCKDVISLRAPVKASASPVDPPTAWWRSISGLSPAHVHQAVNMALQAAVLGYHHAPQIHYTQEGARWEGIDRHRKAWRGEFPNNADCSAYVTWCLWNGLDHFHHNDNVNGQNWRAGYTGTLATHGRQVSHLLPGDIVLYGSGWPYDHTALYTGGGLVVSHGSEIGPLLLPYDYRRDVAQFRRYI